jgi:hypothetical protein
MHSCINLTRALQQNQNETGPRRLSRRPPYDLRVFRLLDDLHAMQIDHSNVSVAVSAILQFTVDQNVDQFVDDILEMFHAHLLAEVLVVVELKKTSKRHAPSSVCTGETYRIDSCQNVSVRFCHLMVRHRILISQMFQLLNDGTHEIVLVVQHQGAPRRLQEFDYLLKPLKKKNSTRGTRTQKIYTNQQRRVGVGRRNVINTAD